KEVTQEKLLEIAMTMNPDVICVAEMKGAEAFAAEEAAITGHTVITTTHADSCRSTYYRMADLCQSATNIDYKILLEKSRRAFPIVAFVKKCKDNVRRILEITECIRKDDGSTEIKTLFRYRKGKFEKVANPSERIRNLLEEDGVSSDVMDYLFGEVL
ncbi:MAG: Flp pilus assembly complex ATPase component TadA, partial [Clostridium sp.]|nr:Flp pilus assembly complex ATPase component TadA [Clostridium sp.]